MVSLSNHWRTNEPLRKNVLPLLRLRFQTVRPRWAWNELAHLLRRYRSLLRQSRGFHRSHREQGGHSQRARRGFSRTATTEGSRDLDQESVRPYGHTLYSQPTRRYHTRIERATSLPLLRSVWSRLPHRFELCLQPSPNLPGDEDRQAKDCRYGDGTRGSYRCQRKSRGSFLHRQTYSGGKAYPMPSRDSGSECL